MSDSYQSISIGEVLSEGVNHYAKSFIAFTILAMIVYSPMFVIEYNYSFDLEDMIKNEFLPFMAFSTLSYQILSGIITYVVFMRLIGEKQSFINAFGPVISRMPVLLLTLFVYLLITALGFILLIVPGYIATIAFSLCSIVCIIERESPIESIKRSVFLTKGYRWKLFGFGLIFGIIVVVRDFFLKAMLTAGTPLFIAGLFTIVSTILLSNVNAACLVEFYYRFRREKEGLTAEKILDIFRGNVE